MATIAENLSRIQSAKTDIKTAIEAKGVTVPSSATIDTYATYVSQISGGGASTPSNLDAWTYDDYGKITSAVIKSGITSINDCTFYKCHFLSAVTIPNTVTRIGILAFYQCFSYGESNITIPDSVTSIGVNAFSECEYLTDVTIGSGIRSIDNYAFSGCTILQSITVNATTPPSVSSGAFANTPIENGDGWIYVPEESVDLYKASSGFSAYSAHITCIGCSTCSEKLCGIDENGDEFTIYNDGTDSLTTEDNIRDYNPIEATIGDMITTIGDSAFNGCGSLTSIDIPSGVTSIGGFAFQNCSGVTSITVNALMPPRLGFMAFEDTNDCPIYVPDESVMDYQEQWGEYADRIQPIQ